MQPLPPSGREVGAEGTRKENAKLQANARNITSALNKNTRSPSPPTADLPLGGSPLNKLNSPINQNLKFFPNDKYYSYNKQNTLLLFVEFNC